jgi:hypothetical protein
MLSLLTQFVRIYFPDFEQLKNMLSPMKLKPKKKSYHKQHPIDQFLLLVIQVFGCLHKQVNVFLHNCANAIWSFKGTKGPPLFIYLGFFVVKKFQLHYKGCKHSPS